MKVSSIVLLVTLMIFSANWDVIETIPLGGDGVQSMTLNYLVTIFLISFKYCYLSTLTSYYFMKFFLCSKIFAMLFFSTYIWIKVFNKIYSYLFNIFIVMFVFYN